MTHRLLVIERDERSCEIVLRGLAGWRGGIDSFADPGLASQAFESGPGAYAAAIVGAVLPRMSGIECAEDLRRIKPDMPVVLMTTPSIARYLNAQRELPITTALSTDALPDRLHALVGMARDVEDPAASPVRR